MSNIGQSPSVKRTRYTTQSTDPVNPLEGDFFVSNGTPRAIGPWVYFSGAWQQVSTSGSLATVNNLTFSPQAADPGTPTEGMVFYADGTSRTEGLWLYMNGSWVQLSGLKEQTFDLKAAAVVRVATTANVTLASQVENGDTIDGVVLATGNRVLLKNQTTASENGIYTVNVSGPPTRATDADTFGELNDYVTTVTAGTANIRTIWFQTATLTSLSDAQVWAATPGVKTFTVPGGVTQLHVVAAGAGGSGGAGGGSSSNAAGTTGGGGGGGGAGEIVETIVPVLPGDVLTITRGLGGAPVLSGGVNLRGDIGNNGTATTITGTGVSIIAFSGAGGGGGAAPASNVGRNGNDSETVIGGLGGTTAGVNGGGGGSGQYQGGSGGVTATPIGHAGYLGGGGGGGFGSNSGTGGAGGRSIYVSTGAIGGAPGGNAAGGGGGGAAIAVGGAGGAAGTVGTDAATNSGAGGGGGGGGTGGGGVAGAASGRGGTGYVRFSW